MIRHRSTDILPMEGLDLQEVSQIVALGPLGVVVYIAWRLLQVAQAAVNNLSGLVSHLEDGHRGDSEEHQEIRTAAESARRAARSAADSATRNREDLEKWRRSIQGSIGQLTRRYADLEARIGQGPLEPEPEAQTFEEQLARARRFSGVSPPPTPPTEPAIR